MDTLCVIDADPLLRDALADILSGTGGRVFAFPGVEEAVAFFRQRQPDLIVCELGPAAVRLCDEVRRLGLDSPIVFTTPEPNGRAAMEAMRLGAFSCISRPSSPDETRLVVERALQNRILIRQHEVMQRALEDVNPGHNLVGESPAFKPVLEKIRRVATSSASVLVTGETAVGKQAVARAIHHASPRASRPILHVNCAGLRADLPAEIFGHEESAAPQRLRKGRLELADGGTLVLVEVGDIDPDLQMRVLRVIEEQEFERVGGSVTRRADTRIIATTTRDLRTLVARGRFREELYNRLSVLTLEVPPLRERIDDIPTLLDHFMQRMLKRGYGRPHLNKTAIAALAQHHWPGNVRELENLCDRLCVLHADRTLGPQDITRLLTGGASNPAASPDGPDFRPGSILADAERELILRTLRHNGGHREKTARALGIGLRTLGMKLKKYRDEGDSKAPGAAEPAASSILT